MTQPSIKVVGKIGQILELFREEGPELRLQDIAAGTGIDMTTTSRIASSLCQIGMLRFDSVQRLYSPGLIMIELSRSVISRFSFHELVHRELLAISNEKGWSSYLGVLDDSGPGSVVYLDAVSTRLGVTPRTAFGERLPAHTTGSGKVLLAFNRVDPADLVLNRLTPQTHTDVDALRAELATIRDNGYGITMGEAEGDWCSVAAPIFDSRGVAAAIGVEARIARWEEESAAMISTVVAKAQGISAVLRLRGGDPISAIEHRS